MQGEQQPVATPRANKPALRIVPFLGDQTIKEAMPGLFAPPGTHMFYFGGPVISNVHVVQVLYGTGNFLPNVTSTVFPSVASFFTDVTQSSYLDILSEYSTQGVVPSDGGASSNQTIAHGFFDGQFTITPSAANNGPNLTDNQIQNELLAQVTAGHLPAPVLDAQGNNNTLYMVYFPAGVNITLAPGVASCVRGGFCAYHNSTAGRFSTHPLLYGVMPDMQPPSLCASGCGSTLPFDNVTIVTSHELSEAISDAQVGDANSAARPLGWIDPNTGAEIGDVCTGIPATVTVNNHSYSVQQEWSNLQNQCAGGPVTYFFDAPFTINSGKQFSMTVNASSGSNVVTPLANYRGTVHFTSTDPTAVLPADYTYTFADAGSHIFVVTLNGTGTQSLTVTDTQFPFTGTITKQLQPPNPVAAFLLSAPSNATTGSPITLTITARDALFNPVPGYNGTIHFTSSDAAAALPPDTAVVNGTAVLPATMNTSAFGQTITVSDKNTPSITGFATVNVVAGGTDSTSTILTASPNPSTLGQSVTYTATVTGGTVPLSGSVLFAVTTGGTLDAQGHAQATLLLGPGTHTVFADYNGTNKPSSSAPFTAVVNPAPATVSLSSSQSAGTFGDAVTFTALLTSPVSPFTFAIPQSGSITINDGATPLAVLFAPVVNAGGVSFTTSQLPTGQHSLTATFSGNSGYAAATSAPLNQIVNPAGSPDFSFTASSTSATVLAGQTANLSITMKSLNGFTGVIKLSCGNLPAFTTCTFSPSTEFVVTAGSGFATVLIKTTGPHLAMIAPQRPGRTNERKGMWATLSLAVCGMFLMGAMRKRKYLAISAVLAVIAMAAITGCGGSGGPPIPQPTPTPQVTPAGTTTINVIATATPSSGPTTTTTKQIPISLTVQP
jgi:Bacterial Ig-like domain (group 3)